MNIFNHRFIYLLALVLFCSCQKIAKPPEEILRKYINYRIEGVKDREILLDYTTNPLYEKISSMSKNDFLKFVGHDNQKNVNILINKKDCQDKVCYITYTANYLYKNSGETYYEINTSKKVEMHFIGFRWRIADIFDLKSSYKGSPIVVPKN